MSCAIGAGAALPPVNDGSVGCWAAGAAEVSVCAGGSGGTVTVISSAERGSVNAPPAKISKARYPFSLDTAALPRQKISRFLIISSRTDLRQIALAMPFLCSWNWCNAEWQPLPPKCREFGENMG